MRRHPRGRRAPRSSRARPRVEGRELSQDPTGLALVEAAIRRTRRDALVTPVAMLALLGGALVAMPGHPVAIIIGVLNVIGLAAAARRLWVLRRSGPFVTAMLDRPAEVLSIEQRPKKLRPPQQPFLISVRTTGAHCALVLDRKHHEDNAALVRTLHERAPGATVVYPSLSTAPGVR